ncbi:unnamed protein product [Dimorphilus gyrociliatus]|uniref:Translocon-associated protein subunit delta n=1 Tax=Dimorphilus gyrociliatus TaxID=2664684 RepID=A0A7I8W5U7_9ANNE|nr:unnamed protein product [Dimorphilus gyrociliatus]
MVGKSLLNLAVFLFFSASLAWGDKCLSPKVQSKVYSTSESILSSQTVFVVEFGLTCKNNVENLNLYADLNGFSVPATRVEGSRGKYQVSFSDEHKKLPSGQYSVRIFDDDGFGELRKAQRLNEDTSGIASLFEVKISHSGASRSFIVQTEFVVALLGIVVWYLAFNAKSKLQA